MYDIGMFFPWAPRKNALTQLGALALLKDSFSLTLHGNGIPQQYTDFCDIVGIPVIDHGWMREKEYFNKILDMHLGLHVTLSEAFGYGVADFLCLSKPVLISESIADNFYIYPKSVVYDYLVVETVDSPSEIAKKISRIFMLNDTHYEQLCDACLKEVEATAWVNNDEVKQMFEKKDLT